MTHTETTGEAVLPRMARERGHGLPVLTPAPKPGGMTPAIRALGIAARKQPVAAHGWEWLSQADAARAMGINPTTVFHALRRGTFAALVLRRLGVKG